MIDWTEDHVVVGALYSVSYVFRALVHAYASKGTGPLAQHLEALESGRFSGRGTFVPLSVAESMRRLQQLQKDLGQVGARLSLVIEARDTFYQEAAARAGLDVVSISFPVGTAYHGVGDSHHYNHRGHALIAEQLAVAVTTRLAALGK